MFALLAAHPAVAGDVRALELAQNEPSEPPSEQPPAEKKPEEKSGESGANIPGVEVMFVKGRSGTAIETEVPSSITQFDASTIQAIGAQNISDLARVTPNVQIVQPGATQATFYVRGIGLQSFDANATGAVTIFQDDVGLDLPAIQTGQRSMCTTEIVRGPQGNSAHRNASGGAIEGHVDLRRQLRIADPTEHRALRSHGGRGAHQGLIQDYEGYPEAPDRARSAVLALRVPAARCGAVPTTAAAMRSRSRSDCRGRSPTRPTRDICGERGSAIWPANQVSRIPVGLPSEVD
jgi:hypothetical protein